MEWFQANLLLSAGLAAILALLAYGVKAITIVGALVGFAVATAILYSGGLQLFLLLLLFVGCGAFFAKLPKTDSPKADQHSVRGGFQVFATIGIAGLFALMMALRWWQDAMWQRALVSGIVVVLAASFSDTLSAELGSRYGGTPRKLLFGKQLEPGQSGGMTLFGLAIGALAAFTIPFLATKLGILPRDTDANLAMLAFAGNLFDSVLGAFVQATYRCEKCGFESEISRHCNAKGTVIHGLPVSNAGVNLIVTVVLGVLVVWWNL